MTLHVYMEKYKKRTGLTVAGIPRADAQCRVLHAAGHLLGKRDARPPTYLICKVLHEVLGDERSTA